MNLTEKEISYKATNSYSTLSDLTELTKYVWFVCHGMGQLSSRFITSFKNLDQKENYIIAPQAPSKYYHSKSYKSVGACWLTKENTKKETENVMRYFDSILENEQLSKDLIFNYLGYSQGVSVVMRYIASRKIKFKNLILFAGGIPIELNKEDFDYLTTDHKIFFLYGDKDEFLGESRICSEKEKLKELFPNRHRMINFDGNHNFDFEVLQKYL